MPSFPATFMTLISRFAPLFTRRVWRHIPLLLVGALLTPGEQLVTTALRAVGLGQTRTFQTYHRVLVIL